MSGGVTAVIAHVEREWSAKLTKKVDIVFHTVRKFSQIEGLIIEIWSRGCLVRATLDLIRCNKSGAVVITGPAS